MPEKLSFTKSYTSKEQKDLDDHQSKIQSDPQVTVDKFNKIVKASA